VAPIVGDEMKRRRHEKFSCPHCGRKIRNQKLHNLHLHPKLYHIAIEGDTIPLMSKKGESIS
jgi:ubiquitin C-terminal hydrolase